MADSKKYNGSTWEHSLRKLTTATDTLTTLPADIYADGTNATVGLKGNMSQTGTPTPDNPIMPQGCGERTGNLADITTFQDNMSLDITTGLPVSTGNNRIANVTPIDVTSNTTVKVTFVYSGQLTDLRFMYSVFNNGALIERVVNKINGDTINVQNADKLYICIYVVTKEEISNLMVSEGSGSVPYEPYGVKIPISSAGQTTPVYLGEVQTTRKIKKLVLTGEEGFTKSSTADYTYYRSYENLDIDAPTERDNGLCSHATIETALSRITDGKFIFAQNGMFFRNDSCSSANEFNTWLANQYSAGNPVCFWYILETATTGIVNEPLMRIGDYADTLSGITIPTITGRDTFDVETTLKPSETSLSYTGWHDATVKEWDGSQWNE